MGEKVRPVTHPFGTRLRLSLSPLPQRLRIEQPRLLLAPKPPFRWLPAPARPWPSFGSHRLLPLWERAPVQLRPSSIHRGLISRLDLFTSQPPIYRRPLCREPRDRRLPFRRERRGWGWGWSACATASWRSTSSFGSSGWAPSAPPSGFASIRRFVHSALFLALEEGPQKRSAFKHASLRISSRRYRFQPSAILHGLP